MPTSARFYGAGARARRGAISDLEAVAEQQQKTNFAKRAKNAAGDSAKLASRARLSARKLGATFSLPANWLDFGSRGTWTLRRQPLDMPTLARFCGASALTRQRVFSGLQAVAEQRLKPLFSGSREKHFKPSIKLTSRACLSARIPSVIFAANELDFGSGRAWILLG